MRVGHLWAVVGWDVKAALVQTITCNLQEQLTTKQQLLAGVQVVMLELEELTL